MGSLLQLTLQFGLSSASYIETPFNTFNDVKATVRGERSKGWAFTNKGPFTNTMEFILDAFGSSKAKRHWNWAEMTLNYSDPHSVFCVFTNGFLNTLLV